MIKNFICWIWGHKIRERAFTGRIVDSDGYDRYIFKWEYKEKCPRCGKKIT